ncbi:YraN family protein [Calditrichota bacterium]
MSQLKTMDKREKGRQAEEVVCAFLEGHGYKVLTTNYHTRQGEIDIVAMMDKTLVFVEVKSGEEDIGISLAEKISIQKQGRIVAAAEKYLLDNDLGHDEIRFDATLVYPVNQNEWKIDHIIDAFRI